jgi:asparagine synthase (glutamine-hydrolysing)
LPEEILHRRKKGFGVPIAKWLKTSLKDLFEGLLSSDRIKREGFLNHGYVTTLLRDHLANRRDNRKQLWTLLVWELWVNRYHPSI